MSTLPANPVELATDTTWSQYDYSNVSVEKQGVLFGRKAELVIAKKANPLVVNKGDPIALIDPTTGFAEGTQLTTEALVLAGTEHGGTTSSGEAGFHFTFHVASNDNETPNMLTLKIYNLSEKTMDRLVGEFDQVAVSAGYEHSNYGLIFTGSVKQYRRGKESATDNFLEILAGDNDIGYNFGFINTTLTRSARNVTWNDIYEKCCAALQVRQDNQSKAFLEAKAAQMLREGGIVNMRGRTLFNMTRVVMRELADSVGARWSIQNGTLVVIPNQGVRAGTYVVLGPETGLVGIPHATDQGIEARVLLNPNLAIGTQVGIQKDSIVETTTLDHFRPNLGYVAYTSSIGQYRILSIDHYGDTRGQDWYTDITCIALNPSGDKNYKALLSGGPS